MHRMFPLEVFHVLLKNVRLITSFENAKQWHDEREIYILNNMQGVPKVSIHIKQNVTPFPRPPPRHLLHHFFVSVHGVVSPARDELT